MEMIKVESSTVNAISYQNNILFVRFNNGGVQMYEGISEELYESFKNSESKGKFLNENIKNKYECSKLTNQEIFPSFF